MPTNKSYHFYLIESLKDPQEAAAYLEAVLEDGNDDELRLALRNIVEARLASLNSIQITANREIFQEILSPQAHMDLASLLKTLGELGFKLSVTPIEEVA